eukprot:393911-Rhodomonas_salina.2
MTWQNTRGYSCTSTRLARSGGVRGSSTIRYASMDIGSTRSGVSVPYCAIAYARHGAGAHTSVLSIAYISSGHRIGLRVPGLSSHRRCDLIGMSTHRIPRPCHTPSQYRTPLSVLCHAISVPHTSQCFAIRDLSTARRTVSCQMLSRLRRQQHPLCLYRTSRSKRVGSYLAVGRNTVYVDIADDILVAPYAVSVPSIA